MQIGEWYFDVVRVKARKVDEYGKPFTATCDITITDGTPHVEGLISKERLTKKDREALNEYLTGIGYSKYTCSHFEDGERIITEIEIK